EHVYAARADAVWPGMSSIVHGDLNLNNVLLDEKENIYVIDFSETHIGDLSSDFSRLEPIALLQMTRTEKESDIAALLRYIHAIVRPERMFDPPYAYDGDDPFMPKAHALVRLLREEVRQLSGGRHHAAPYLLGLLHWSLPVVMFRQMSLLGKQTSCYASALLTEALLEADPEAARLFHPPAR
ncbi:MAG: phosphotransferase, partial [Terrimicrobiaceae bacterium]